MPMIRSLNRSTQDQIKKRKEKKPKDFHWNLAKSKIAIIRNSKSSVKSKAELSKVSKVSKVK